MAFSRTYGSIHADRARDMSLSYDAAPTLATERSGSLSHRERASARRMRRLTGERNQRRLADGLRRAAGAGPVPRRHSALLRDRAVSVRPELLAIAATLEQVVDPDPTWMAAIQRLLCDACGSPLYNLGAPVSDLLATVCELSVGPESARRVI
jgi:hypothetical protein